MALQDIIAAIIAQADAQISDKRSMLNKKLSELKEESERSTAGKKQEIAQQKEERKNQMRAKAQARAQMIERSAELAKKQELLDRLYADTITALTKLPEKDQESFLERCLKKVKGKGVLRPAKGHAASLKKLLPKDVELGDPIEAEGGFIFQSEKEERDFTFEHLVQSALRPSTEVESAQALF